MARFFLRPSGTCCSSFSAIRFILTNSCTNGRTRAKKLWPFLLVAVNGYVCVRAREFTYTHERDRVDSTVVAGSEVLIALHVRNSWILKFPSCRVLAVFKDGCRRLCRASGSTGAVEIAHSHLGVAVIAGDWTRSIRGLATGPHRVIAN